MTDRAALLCFLDGTDAGIAAAVDWLQERGATLADVLLLYAGTPPDWLAQTHAEDEALRGLVAAWCRQTERRRLAEYPDFRWERVESLRGNYWEAMGRLDLARARRAQKRAVLALFPEVSWEVRIEIPPGTPARQVEAMLNAAGMLHASHIGEQTNGGPILRGWRRAAPDWILSEEKLVDDQWRPTTGEPIVLLPRRKVDLAPHSSRSPRPRARR